ncbi:hypothetical protein ABS767_02490 [Sphingomonas sp. ST-64]|uniref:Uncharacterized protein n=1 Tax=Sphingomonas plantiphila TaxID=3163295 RepID=A0ABW8YKS4_9SPHN
MLFKLIYRRRRDREELSWLRGAYGHETRNILRGRARNGRLKKRDQRHWRRLYCRAVIDSLL